MLKFARLLSRFEYMQWYQGAVDAIKSKLYFPVSQKMSRKHQQNICHIEFFNKAVD